MQIGGMQERAGGGGSPVQVRQQSKITPEPQAEPIFIIAVSPAGIPPLTGTHMFVCSNRWSKVARSVVSCLQGAAFFIYRKFSYEMLHRIPAACVKDWRQRKACMRKYLQI